MLEESIADTMLKAADVMHFLGHHRVGNAMILFSRLARAHSLNRLDELERFVERQEYESVQGA